MFVQQLKISTQLLLRVAIVIVIALVLGTTTMSAYAAAPARPSIEGTATTPYQTSLSQAIAERQAAGLPVPSSINFDVQRTDGMAQAASARGLATAPTVTVTATTTIEFDNPQQAGYDEWPALVVENNLPEEFSGEVLAGDYTETYREKLAEQLPGIWETYEFGQEPRTYTTTETINITYPAEVLPGPSLGAMNATTSDDVLMGFTYSGPHIDYTIGDRLEICLFGLCGEVYEFKAGFELDWAMGLRLPAHATLNGPAEMVQGNPYNFTTSLEALDWSAEQYAASGVAAESGNEFALRLYFFAGVKAEIFGGNICPGCYAELDFDESESFTTPFGSEAEFPIPSATIPIYKLDLAAMYFALGLKIDPHLTSTMITADWAAVPGSDCGGSGTLTYTAPGAPVTFGPVTACNNGPSELAEVKLDNFRYHFNEFVINLLAYLEFNVFGYGLWTPTISIASLDLSPITGGLNLGDHVQCNWAFNCSEAGPGNELLLSIPVSDETPPTTSITLAGTEGTNGWYVSDVTVTLSPEDGPPDCGAGIASTEYSFDNTSWNAYSGPFTLTEEGTHTVYYRSADNEGNVEEAGFSTIRIDKTPPVITGAPTTPANSYSWYNTDVVVHFEATDAVSGVASVTENQTLSAEGADQSVTGTAVDVAGNSASATVAGINIDKTNPVVTITSPTATVYNNTDSLTTNWSVIDNLSGVASESGRLDRAPVTNGQLIDLLLVAAGSHTVSVSGTDKADNTASTSVKFQVHVDAKGLLASLNHMCDLGWIDRWHCKSLRAKLKVAIAAIDRGKYHTAEHILNAFIHELKALRPRHLSWQAYKVLKADAEYVIDALPDHPKRWFWPGLFEDN